MSDTPKPTTRHLRRVEQVLKSLDSEKPSNRLLAIEKCGRLTPNVGSVLAALLRLLNDPDELLRLKAIEALTQAFPEAEEKLTEVLSPLESDDPKVRLAATSQVIIILAQRLAALSGVGPFEPPPRIDPHQRVKEDVMTKHAGRWVAWTNDRQRFLAVADSFTDVMNSSDLLVGASPDLRM